MSTDFLVIVDQQSFSFGSSDGSFSLWTLISFGPWYRRSIQYAHPSATQVAAFTFTFNGTSAGFIGDTPPFLPETATVQIDNGTPFVIDYGDLIPLHYMQWFTTPTLPDGKHTVTISDLNQTKIDYAIVTVGKDTSLTGQTVIVDDDSSLIQYSGKWSRNTNKFVSGIYPTGYPYGNVTHRSSNPGDSFTFRFSGMSIAVYGVFSWYNLGTLTATYSINGTTYPSSLTVTTSTPEYLSGNGEMSNYLYFGLESLPGGIHTLLVNITEAGSHSFILDYITYVPAFDTLSSMPSNVSSVMTDSASSILQKSTGSPERSVQTRTIIGGVLGGLAFGVSMAILVILFILRRRNTRDYAYQNATSDSYVSQMQESSPNPANFPVKHANHGMSNSNPQHSNAPLVVVGSSRGPVEAEVPLHDPPAYDAISNLNRVSHQP